MRSYEQQDDVLSMIQRLLSEEKAYHQAQIERIESLERELATLKSDHSTASTGRVESDEPARIMIANGRRLTEEEILSVKKDDFDVILDMTTNRLEYRLDPAKHTRLTESNLQGIGAHRIKILVYMLEHFESPICAENAPMAYGDADDIKTLGAFTKTVSVLRQALGEAGKANPYLLDEPAWELSSRNNARAYRLNPMWRYLLVKVVRKKSY